MVDYIYSTLNLDLDYVLPFAAIPENGREIDGLDDKSELAHHVMLVNLLRLLGAVKQKKASRNSSLAQLKLFSRCLFGIEDMARDALYAMELGELGRVSWPCRRHYWVSLFHHTSSASVYSFWANTAGLEARVSYQRQTRRSHILCQRNGIQHSWPHAPSPVQHHTGRAYLG